MAQWRSQQRNQQVKRKIRVMNQQAERKIRQVINMTRVASAPIAPILFLETGSEPAVAD